MEYERFFAELTARLNAAEKRECEFDRKLAHRFNVFDYLRDDELGLSRVIADLLDPKATHGQGALFLQTLLSLEGLRNARSWPDVDGPSVRFVKREWTIPSRRRIDIFVEIVGADGAHYGLAVENKKPDTADQENQVLDYLTWLKKEYPARFLLIYLSPRGERPSDTSISKAELEKQTDGFAIMPYWQGHEQRTNEDSFRLPHSFADWLQECRRNCEADNMRRFLGDFEVYCNRTFGGQGMNIDSKTQEAVNYLLLHPDILTTARAVTVAWPHVRDDVCEKFLERLCSRIKTEVKARLKDFGDDMEVSHTYFGHHDEPAGRSRISLCRDCWARDRTERRDPIRRPRVLLQADRKSRPDGWYIAVLSPMFVAGAANGEKERRSLDGELEKKLGHGKTVSEWPWWKWVDDDKQNWNELVPVLHQENQGNGNEITEYFVNKFIEVAEKAIPVINDIEG